MPPRTSSKPAVESFTKNLTPDQRSFITYLEQSYLLEGAVPSVEVVVKRKIATEKFYKDCLANPTFVAQLTARGVAGVEVSGSRESGWLRKHGLLTEEQLVAANIMLDLRDNRSQRKKLQELGIPTQKWEGWLRDPIFNKYLRTRAEAILPDNLHEAHLALLDRVRSGDTTAIKFFYEITGRYVPLKGTEVDVMLVLTRVVEIIQRHVTDIDTMLAISDDLSKLAVGNLGVMPGVNSYNGVGRTANGQLKPSITIDVPALESGPVEAPEKTIIERLQEIEEETR